MKSAFFRFTFYVALGCVFSALFYSDISFAESGASSLPSPFTVPITDVSYGYLSKMFGALWGLPGSTTTLLGIVFRDFNYGIMAVVPLVISYTTVRVIIDTAYSGESMGKKISHWVIVRTLAGIGLLVPKVGGYTVLQGITMWIILQGIGVADFIWQDTLNYLRKGGVIYEGISNKSTASALKINGDLVTGGDNINGSKSNNSRLNFYSGSMGILRSQVCMKALQDALNDEKKSASEYTKAPVADGVDVGSDSFKAAKNFANADIRLFYDLDTTEKSITFPGKKSLPSVAGFDLKDFEGACGKYRWAWDLNQGAPEEGSAAYQKDFNFNDTAYQNAKQAGVLSMVSSVESLAGSILNNNELASYDSSKYDKFSDLNVRLRDTAVNAATSYQAIISDIRTAKALKYKSRDEIDKKDKKFFDDAYKRGWATAGEYYYSLTKMQKRETDMTFYKIWTKNEEGSVETQGRDLRPSPMIISGATGGPNETLTFLYNTFERYGRDVPYKWSSDKLRSRLNAILSWTNNVNDTEIQPYVNNMNDILDQSGSTLDLSDNADFKKFVDKIKDLKEVSSTTSSESAQKILKDLESSIKKFDILNPAQAVKSGIDAVTYGLVGMTSYTSDALGINSNAIKNPLHNCTTKVLKSWVETMTSSESVGAPIQKLNGFGSTILDSVATCWQEIYSNLTQLFQTMLALQALGSAIYTAWTGAIGGLGSVLGALSSGLGGIVNALGTVVSQVVELVISYMWKWVLFTTLTPLPLAMGVTAILFTMGVTLYFYVPLIPYLLFTLGILSWLIFVIEAMTASAIVAFGLMDPRSSGDEVWGKAEPAQMLWLSVFLRPATMLIGLLTGTVLSFVGLVIINTTFMGFLNTFGFSGDVLDLKSFGIMVAYTLMMVTLVNKCYECIYTIPEQIMTWIGVQAKPSSDAQLLHEVKGGLSQIAGETGAVAKGAAEKKGGAVEGVGPPHGKRG